MERSFIKEERSLSLKRVLIGIVRSYDGTSDRAKDPKLKTRYYNLSKEKCFEEVSSTLKKFRVTKFCMRLNPWEKLRSRKEPRLDVHWTLPYPCLASVRFAAQLICIRRPAVL